MPSKHAPLPAMPASLKPHADFAIDKLQDAALNISNTMSKHQLKLADRQCRMSKLSLDVQDMITILITSLFGASSNDEIVQQSADVACQGMIHRITGRSYSDRYFRTVTDLGAKIVDGGFQSIAGYEPDEILMPYENE